MLIYYSKRKIENLCLEFSIDNSFLKSIMPDKIDTRLGLYLGVANGSIESKHTLDNNQLSKVLKKLKSKNALIDLISGETYIKPFNYYICDGTLLFEKRIDGYTSSLYSKDILDKYRSSFFFYDDKLKFRVKISHDKYQFVDFACTVDSIQVFGYRNLSVCYGDIFNNNEKGYHPNSADPGIFERELPVRLIFWCLETNEALGKINGSPLMISC